MTTGRTADMSLENLAIAPLGMPSLFANIGHWVPGANYVITGKPDTGAEDLALSLAEKFESDGGHVVWIGVSDGLDRICEQLMFKKAGIGRDPPGAPAQLDAIGQIKLAYAREQVSNMSAAFCNVDECGDIELEQEFLASVSSFKPTLIVVEESIFDETTLNAFEVLGRQTHARRMVDELRRTNPMSSVLWRLPMSNTTNLGKTKQRPSLDDLPDAASTIRPEVVLFTHRDAGPASKHNSELIVTTNAYGSTGTVPMDFDIKHSTWHEFHARG